MSSSAHEEEGGGPIGHHPSFSAGYRRVITRATNQATTICRFITTLEEEIESSNSFALTPPQRLQCGLRIRPLEQHLATINTTTERWKAAIEELAEPDKANEAAYFEHYFTALVNPEEDTEGASPLELLRIDLEYYLEQLNVHAENTASTISFSRSQASLSGNAAIPTEMREDLHPHSPSNLDAPSPSAAVPPGLVLPVVPDPNEAKLNHAAFVRSSLNPSASVTDPSATAHRKQMNSDSVMGQGEMRTDDMERAEDRSEEGKNRSRGHRGGYRGFGERVNESLIRAEGAATLPQQTAFTPAMNFPLALPSLQLPSMPLPSFDGREPWSFPTFLETFEAVVLANHNLPELQQLHYLRSCLKGEAHDSIESIVRGEGCYREAIDRLKAVYRGNGQEIAALLRQKLQRIKKTTEDSGVKAELKGVRELQALITQLLSHESDHPILTDSIVQKLPERTVKKAVKIRHEKPSTSTLELLQQIETSVLKDLTIERMMNVPKKAGKNENIRYAIEQEEPDRSIDSENEEERESTQQQLMTLNLLNPPHSTPFVMKQYDKDLCSLCGKHKAGQEERCRSYPTPDERIARARQLRRCFRCLGGGAHHNFRLCEALCHHCNGKHHKSLCKRTTNRREARSGEAVRVHTEEVEGEQTEYYTNYYEEMEEELNRDRAEEETVHDIVGAASTVAPIPTVPRIPSSKLMTFQGQLVHPSTGTEYPVNLMLDPGASVSLVSNRVVSILRMAAIGEAETAFAGVGGHTSEFKPHKIFNFKVKTSIKDSEPLKILAYEHPTPLTGPEREFVLSAKDRQFIRKKKLESALLADSDGPPDVLIGQNESLVCMNTGQRIVELPSGMKLQPTCLGYIRTGAFGVTEKESVQCLLPDTIRMMQDVNPHDPLTSVSKRRRIPSGTVSTDLVNVVARAEEARTKLIMENLSRFLSADLAHTEIERDLSDEEVRQHFKDTLHYEEGKGYTVRWARKPGIENLPSNLHVAFQRLLHHKSHWNPKVRKAVDDAVKDLLERGYVEIVPPEEIDCDRGEVYYMPHQTVEKEEKETTKCRMVFDASAHGHNSPSLNDLLWTGPSELAKIPTLLVQFRARPSVVCGDVEKAFHTVKLDKRDRNLCRFLWYKQGVPVSADNPYDESIIHLRFVVVPFGIVQSPFLLNAVIAHHLEKKVEALTNQKNPEDGSFIEETTRMIQLCQDISNNIYVDNVVWGTTLPENLEKDMKSAKALFKEMEMNLRQFLTSEPDVNRRIPAADRAGGEEGVIKVLGIPWDSNKDSLNLTVRSAKSVSTKRAYVSEICSNFDPNGWLAPVTLPLKRMMQKLCTGVENKDWNRKLTEEEAREANACLQAASGFAISIPRYTGPSSLNESNGSLVVFCDASDLAYAAVVYMVNGDGSPGQIIMAKSRLLPLTKPGSRKAFTTPQGEMRALVLGLNLLLTSLKALVNYGAPVGVHRLMCLTDSLITYHRVMNRRTEAMRQMSLFVRNRLLEINRIEDEILSIPVLKGRPLEIDPKEKRIIEFAYVPTSQNPADLATRGTSASELQDPSEGLAELWWKGTNDPRGLMEAIQSFPLPDTPDTTTAEGSNALFGPESPTHEEETTENITTLKRMISEINDQDPLYISATELVDAEDLEAIITLLAERVRIECKKTPSASALLPEVKVIFKEDGPFSPEERQFAENLLLRQHQARFRECWDNVSDHKPEMSEDGLMRSALGRISKADLPSDTKFPILIFPNDPLTTQLVMKYHLQEMHCGTPHTLCSIRTRFWIIKGYSSVKKILKKCSICQRYNQRPFGRPPHGELPEGRLLISRPFSGCGLDYFGPVFYRDDDGKEQKSYVLLFTCATSRAVHLELVRTMGVQDFLTAFTRFANRRGCPKIVWSDNAPTFKLAGKLFKKQAEFLELLKDPKGEVGSALAYWGIKWHLSSPNQPWYGGFWERLVSVAKRCLFRTIGRAILPWDEIVTLLTSVEVTINSRPIMPVPHDLKDFLDAPVMRPIDFIMPGVRCGIADDDDEEEEWVIDGIPRELTPAARAAIKSMRARKKAQLRFWKMWNLFYLTDLRRFHLEKKRKGEYSAENLQIGQFVLIIDDLLPRGRWLTGKIVKIRPSKDGFVRSVAVQTENGTITERPVEHLVPMELEMEEIGLFAFDEDDIPEEFRSEELQVQSGDEEEETPRYNLRSGKKQRDTETSNLLGVEVFHPPPALPPVVTPNPKKPYARSGMPLNSFALICCILATIIPGGAAREFAQAITCLPHGVMVNSTAGYGMQICASTGCQVIPPGANAGSVTVHFPPSISTASFEVFIKIMTENMTISTDRVCPASNVCRNMERDWTIDHLIVPHCYPITTFAILFVLIYLMAVSTTLCVYMTCFRRVTGAEVIRALWHCHRCSMSGIAQLMGLLGMALLSPFCWLRRRLRRPARAQGDGRRRRGERMDGIRRRTQVILGMATLAMLASFPPGALACNHVVIISEDIEKCEGERCQNEKGMEITIDSFSKSGCIKFIRGKEEKIEGTIQFEVISNDLVCARRTEGFHRAAEVHVASSKRCFFSGSCNGQTCENMQTSDSIEEFDHVSNFPGHAHCTESCGGWECGCASFHAGCMFYRTYLIPTSAFYRTYLIPTSAKIYESLRCPSWSSRVILRINLTIGGTKSASTITLWEGELSRNMEADGIDLIRMEEVEKPDYSDMLSQTFLTDGSRMTIARDFRANNRCPDEETARDFRCKAEEQCSCFPVVNKVRCDCDERTMEGYFKLDETLPIISNNMNLALDQETQAPIAHLRRGNVKVYIALSEEIQKARVREDTTECTISVGEAKGCYDCNEGARVIFDCTSLKETEAFLSCGGNSVSLPCGPSSIKSKRALHFDRSSVLVNCHTSCYKGEVIIKGALSTPHHLSPSSAFNRVKGGELPRWDILPDMGPLLDFMSSYWKSTTVLIGVSLLAIATTISLTIGCPASLWWIVPFCGRHRRKGDYKTI